MSDFDTVKLGLKTHQLPITGAHAALNRIQNRYELMEAVVEAARKLFPAQAVTESLADLLTALSALDEKEAEE